LSRARSSLLPDDGECHTVEVSVTTRHTGRSLIQASVSNRWNMDQETGYFGQNLRPLTTPALRVQQGQAHGRTFLAGNANGINYGTQRILAEPIDSRRQDTITILDIRTEKTFTVARGRLGLFVDVYNLTNSDAAQNISWGSGSAFERPVSIVGPTIARFGVKLDW